MSTARRLGWMLGLSAAMGLGLAGWTSLQAEDGGAPKEKPTKDQVLKGPKADADQKGPGGRGFDGKGPGRGPGAAIVDALRDLNLSEEQKNKVREILSSHHEKVKAHREAHSEELAKLRQEFQAAREAKDHEKVKQLAEQRRKIMEGVPKPADLINEVKAVLTPDQAKTFDALLEDAREQMAERHGQMGPGPDGKGPKGEGRGEGKGKGPGGPDGEGRKQRQGPPPGEDKKLDL